MASYDRFSPSALRAVEMATQLAHEHGLDQPNSVHVFEVLWTTDPYIDYCCMKVGKYVCGILRERVMRALRSGNSPNAEPLTTQEGWHSGELDQLVVYANEAAIAHGFDIILPQHLLIALCKPAMTMNRIFDECGISPYLLAIEVTVSLLNAKARARARREHQAEG